MEQAPNILEQGIELMLYGMGTVFVFLAVLVVVTIALSTFIQKFLPETETPVTPQSTAPVAGKQDDQLMAVISAAVHKYRSRNQK